MLVKALTNRPVLVNLGGDLAVTGSRDNNQPWQVAIDSPDSIASHLEQNGNKVDMIVPLFHGGTGNEW